MFRRLQTKTKPSSHLRTNDFVFCARACLAESCSGSDTRSSETASAANAQLRKQASDQQSAGRLPVAASRGPGNDGGSSWFDTTGGGAAMVPRPRRRRSLFYCAPEVSANSLREAAWYCTFAGPLAAAPTGLCTDWFRMVSEAVGSCRSPSCTHTSPATVLVRLSVSQSVGHRVTIAGRPKKLVVFSQPVTRTGLNESGTRT